MLTLFFWIPQCFPVSSGSQCQVSILKGGKTQGGSWPREGACLAEIMAMGSVSLVLICWPVAIGTLCLLSFKWQLDCIFSSLSCSVMSLISFTPSQCQQNSTMLHLTPYSTLKHHLLITTIIYQPARLPRTESWFHHLQTVWYCLNTTDTLCGIYRHLH